MRKQFLNFEVVSALGRGIFENTKFETILPGQI